MTIQQLTLEGKWESKAYSHDPHQFLGLHELNDKEKVIRLWRPSAETVYIEVKGEIFLTVNRGYGGIFEIKVPSSLTALDYRVYHQNGLLAHDPYAFSPTFGEIDGYLFSKGVHYKLYEVLGARVCNHQGCSGVKFAVWAPFARQLSVIGDFNHWDGRVNLMRSMGTSGGWELFIPGLKEGEKYKFEIQTKDGKRLVKSDPFAYASECRPFNASIVNDVDSYVWQDNSWMEKRKHGNINTPINVYEVHLGSWNAIEGFPGYKEIAHSLAKYVKEMAFTHVEIMPLAEHPLDESWGYQISGFYAVTSRYGTPQDFQYFVDHLHQQGIGVIIDWVPAHFPMDDFALASFDGTCLYEHEDPKQGYHPHWNTNIFNYGRFEVSNFLLANALFWLDKMHVDGLRVDAVASMLYLDYGRKEGEWIPNAYGGKENLEALEFIKHVNSVVHEKFPTALMIAEESTAFYGVTHPLDWGGLGFDLKWNMGWMNDTLAYFKTDPFFRSHHHNSLTFGLCYVFSERFMLTLSHDEVVHGKASLLSKMPGDNWQKFANLRLLYSYMICQPGKKLLFMGGEIGQWAEWNCKTSLDWFLLEYPLHKGMQTMVRELNQLYQSHPSLWEKDFDPAGFVWIDCSDRKNSILSYLRKGKREMILCVHNFTPSYFEQYEIRLANVLHLQEVFSSDKEEYGGSGKLNKSIPIQKDAITLQIAPLATMIFEVTFAS
ncbi:MAG: 1,4-alpha-glucan branching protein GlgB [Verrucomicrobia bacterium]|nr:1,4-alpha-glucan branching protein GlgB [Verrucomicrobiota bacterium]